MRQDEIDRITAGAQRVVHNAKLTTPDCVVDIPVNAMVLSCGIQDDVIVVWYETRVRNLDDKRHARFRCVNTGDRFQIPNPAPRFVGTVMSDNGIVWHVHGPEWVV